MTDREEYEKYVAPDIAEYKERLRKAMVAGIENAKQASERKRRYIEAKQRWNRRREVGEKYDV